MGQNPKHTRTNLRLKHEAWGHGQVMDNYMDSLDHADGFPKPVEYEDIDRAVLEFVRDKIVIPTGDKFAPTFTLFSNQRFSEYSQTWEHVDEEGNLLMDFKTVNRELNPKWGNSQGGDYNIPGDRRYTVLMKEVLDDNGTESYEVHSMAQPLSVDINYTVNFVTADWDQINVFNEAVINLFRSLQHYINPNGHYMPLKIDQINDETEYAIDNRKIYIQSISLVLYGYVIPKASYKIEKFPKRTFIGTAYDKNYLKPHVDVEDIDDSKSTLVIDFRANVDKSEFTFDDNMKIDYVETDNIRDFKIYLNEKKIPYLKNDISDNEDVMKKKYNFKITLDGEPVTVWLHDEDEVRILITHFESPLPSKMIFHLTR